MHDVQRTQLRSSVDCEAAAKGTASHRLIKVVTAVLLDGDDTLWMTEQLYDDARNAARRVVETAGLDGARWEQLEREIDVRNVALLGHAPERFPRSCEEAYRAICAEHGLEPDPAAAAEVRTVAAGVFRTPAPLNAHARTTLEHLRERGLRLVLLTKGDRNVQTRRIEESGLSALFEQVHIVDRKTPGLIQRIVHDLGVAPAHVLSVGNSVRSDVLPSLEAGLHAVWIPAHVWEYERAHDHLVPDEVAVINDLADLVTLVDDTAALSP